MLIKMSEFRKVLYEIYHLGCRCGFTMILISNSVNSDLTSDLVRTLNCPQCYLQMKILTRSFKESNCAFLDCF